MSYAGATFFVISFTILLFSLGLVRIAKDAIDISRQSVAILRNPKVTDLEKEKTIQANAIGLFVILGKILLISAIAIAVPLGLIYSLDMAGLLSFASVLEAMQDLKFLTIATVLGFIIYFVQKKIRP